MTVEEQNFYLSAQYAEAVRYMDNAKETLKKAEKQDDGYYNDPKYVRSACGIAYLGVLLAVDAWLTLKNVPLPDKKKHRTIEFYEHTIAKIDKKMLVRLNAAYEVLHLVGYYRGVTKADTIKSGFNAAYEIIEKIKPEHPIEMTETNRDKTKRAWNRMLVSLAVMFMR